jgi:hypothetical protein
MKNALLFFCFLSVLGHWSCTEDPPAPEPEPTLPPITQTGENTFGCYVNGELWLPKGNIQNYPLFAGYYNNYLQIDANRVGANPYTSIEMNFGKVYSDTVFAIHNYSDSAGMQFFNLYSATSPSGPIRYYDALGIPCGQMHLIRFDTINRIVAGTFDFIAVDTVSGDTVFIEDGRFDLQF